VSLQPAVATAAGETTEDKVGRIAADLAATVPEDINLEEAIKAKEDDQSALNVVLFQEIERYLILLNTIRRSLSDVQKGIKGLVVMSLDLEEVFNCLLDGKVPPAWQKAYPSVKNLSAWYAELAQRIETLREWADGSYPKVYWLGGFTYPTGFLTAVLQTSARKNNVSIDGLSWDFLVSNTEEKDITQPPRDGVYIKGMFLEGASWDHQAGCLAEPRPMELIVSMPIIQFKPVESKKKAVKGTFSCPCYLYPVRTGTRERPSFTIAIDLKSGSAEPEFWTKRGTAILLTLAY